MAFIAPRYIIKNLMRILTPEEIDLLTTIDTGRQKISLTKILLNKINGINEIYEEGFLVLHNNVKNKKDKKNKYINEVNKTKKSLQKIKKKEILEIYKKNSQLDVNKEINKEDLKKSPIEGVLIDKKQS
ncbi:MAG: hypothetical protein OXB84_02610 [Halobacteriovoraceae bacterium]|nr:hypothetical protein [Halobacteriovoraceae bacterium]